MDYGLAALAGRHEVFVSIQVDEFRTLKSARSSLLECLYIEEKYEVLIENYLEFETAGLDFAARSMVFGPGNWDYYSLHLARSVLDRRLANLLSAGRMYEDHMSQHVHRALPDEQAKLKDLFVEAHDTRFGFRCMQALRNHVQHSGLPVHRVSANSNRTSLEDTAMLRFGFTPYLEAKYLRSNPKFNKRVLQEIEERGGKLDLKGLVREYIEGISFVHSRIRSMLQDRSLGWESVLARALSRLSDASGDSSDLWLVRAVSLNDGQQTDEFEVFTELIERRKHLQNKNEAPQNLTRRFATNEVHPAEQ